MISEEPLDHRYFYWLYQQVAALTNPNPARGYFKLLEQLHRKEFTWFVENDHNRMEDGLLLRNEFLRETRTEGDQDWMELECSMLEMLVALSRRVAFETNGEPIEWFWRMLTNLELVSYTDDIYHEKHNEAIDDILQMVADRTYTEHGVGGLFPLLNADQDQRNVEIWYQMSLYLLEHDYAA